jgi:hypothetical protein
MSIRGPLVLPSILFGTVLILDGCGPIDPSIKWQVHEARLSDDLAIRVIVLKSEQVLGGPKYSSPRIELIERDGVTTQCDLYERPPFAEITKTTSDGHGPRTVPLRLVYEGDAIAEYRRGTTLKGSE